MTNHPNRSTRTAKIIPSHTNSEFSIMYQRDGSGQKLIAGNLSAGQAARRIESLATSAGQPISHDGESGLPWCNESAEERCGIYFVVEDLPEED